MSGFMRRVMSTHSTVPRDTEQGYSADASKAMDGTTGSTVISNTRPMTVMKYDPGNLVPAEDRLLIFRTLTGIDTVPVVSQSGHAARTAANIGIYTRVVRFERSAKKSYRIVKFFASLCFALQIIMGAAVTALGASQGSYSGITGLGAVSTVTASIVAYIKGTGQPQKLKYIESRWKWVREHIEQRERELCLADCPLDVYNEVRIVEEMYQAVKEELEADKTNQGQQNGPPGQAPPQRNSVGGIGGAMNGSNAGTASSVHGLGGGLSGRMASVRNREEVSSYNGEETKETAFKSAARPESTATWACHCSDRPTDTTAIPEKLHKDES